MQTVSSAFTERAKSNVREISNRVMISFPKDYDPSVDFFTLDNSFLDGADILAGDNNVVQEWDKYTYVDYSDRVISVEWQREQANPWSMTLGIADVTFSNTDDFFTTGSGSAIDGNILPRRPIRIYSGFSGEVIQQFIGLTEGVPKLDSQAKTATFHCVDFLAFIYNAALDETEMFIDQRVDQIISSLLQGAGISPSQMDLDTAFTTVPYCYFDKGDKLGDALNNLVEAELGRLYMDENGMIRFANRQNFSEASVYTFTPSNVKSFTTKQYDDLYNVVEVKSQILQVQENQKVYDLSEATLIPAGETVEIWGDFQDPVTSIDTPVNIASATTSLWEANTAADGSGSNYTNITLASHSLFSKSYKMSFTNTGVTDAYITSLQLFGTPVRAKADIYEKQEVSVSIADFDEHLLTIENPFIQDATTARSLAILVSTIYSDLGGANEADVKGTPALQLNDTVTMNVTSDSGEYYISKLMNKDVGNGFEQTIQTQRRLVLSFFTLDSSYLDGSDVLGV